jgi:hypothetical protein
MIKPGTPQGVVEMQSSLGNWNEISLRKSCLNLMRSEKLIRKPGKKRVLDKGTCKGPEARGKVTCLQKEPGTWSIQSLVL